MAQYRAIFQNAYFKGLATAAVVTMGLAAGQAQAQAQAEAFAGTQTVDSTTIIIDAENHDHANDDEKHKFTSINVTTSPTADLTQKAFEITKGATSANKIASSADAVTLTAKSLTIASSSDNAQGLKIDGSTATTTAKFTDSVALTKGTIHLVGKTGSGALESKQIDIGTIAPPQRVTSVPNAIVTLDNKGVLGAEIAEGELNTLGIINLNTDGKIHHALSIFS